MRRGFTSQPSATRQREQAREQVLVWFLTHCRVCGQPDDHDELIEIPSRILGTVYLCRPCAGRAGLSVPQLHESGAR